MTGPVDTIDQTTSDADNVAPEVQWAPAEPRPRRGRKALAIGIPVAVVTAAAVAASLVLIAPGTAVAGVPVGWQTEGMAADTLTDRLSSVSVTLGDDGPTLSAEELGASIDAAALARTAYQEHPMWKLGEWGDDLSPAAITLDEATAHDALRAALPGAYIDPTPAAVSFDGAGYAVTPAVDGVGVDLETVRDGILEGFTSGETVTVDPGEATIASPTTTEMAEATAAELNAMIAEAGFYAGDERTVPVDAATLASWLTVTTDADGAFTIAADAASIQPVVDTLPELVTREPVDARIITNSDGEVLREDTEGVDGLALGDTSGVARGFADQLAAGDASYDLPVEVTPFQTVQVARTVEVDLSEQRIYLRENDQVVDSWYISSGRPGAETFTGRYKIGWKLASQDMRGTSRDTGTAYTQPNVPWVMYFNGNQAFHGAYWHNNFGNRMSAGCVNMPPWRAKYLYDWSPQGTDVWIHP